MNLSAGGVYAILDAGTVPADQRITSAQAALSGGARMLQYRDKCSDAETARTHAAKLLSACQRAGVPLIINDDVALAAAIGADGVHLGRADSTVAEARERLGPSAIIGATCHASLDAAIAAARDGASYVSFGRFFASATKPHAPPADLSILGQARAHLSLPVVAIGGIDADNGGSLIAAGADWLAASGAIFRAQDVHGAAGRIAGLFCNR